MRATQRFLNLGSKTDFTARQHIQQMVLLEKQPMVEKHDNGAGWESDSADSVSGHQIGSDADEIQKEL